MKIQYFCTLVAAFTIMLTSCDVLYPIERFDLVLIELTNLPEDSYQIPQNYIDYITIYYEQSDYMRYSRKTYKLDYFQTNIEIKQQKTSLNTGILIDSSAKVEKITIWYKNTKSISNQTFRPEYMEYKSNQKPSQEDIETGFYEDTIFFNKFINYKIEIDWSSL